MNATSTLDRNLYTALEEAVCVLRGIAEYKLDDDIERRMHDLLVRKDTCSLDEREEHRHLTDLWRKRTLQKLQALDALKHLREAAPELVGELPDIEAEA